MNFVKLGSLTINLDHVAYWDVIPKQEHEKKPNPHSVKSDAVRFYRPADEQIVIIHFVSGVEPLKLGVSPARAFLKLMHESGDIKDAQLELPPAPPTDPLSRNAS